MKCKNCNNIEEVDIKGLVFGCAYCTDECNDCGKLKWNIEVHSIDKYASICVPCFKKR